jgi:hypothetical protein
MVRDDHTRLKVVNSNHIDRLYTRILPTTCDLRFVMMPMCVSYAAVQEISSNQNMI